MGLFAGRCRVIAPPFVGRDKELPFVGRDEELEFLDRLTTGSLPSITFVNGIGGIGKSRVLDAFARRRRAAGAAVVRIDCRPVEPSEAGFLRELRRASGGDIASVDDASRRLGELGSVVLVLDDIDALRLLDTWLRRVFVPALPSNVHVVTSGRDAPLSAWLQMPWRAHFATKRFTPSCEGRACAARSQVRFARACSVR